MEFDKNIFYGFLIQGDLFRAIAYAKKFPSERDRVLRYEQIFDKEKYRSYPLTQEIQNILLTYQQYYRDIFYIGKAPEQAEKLLSNRLAILSCGETSHPLDDLEETILPEIFQKQGLYFMGGKTEGFYGPYVWQSIEQVTYQVPLPAGIQPYTVRLHRGFIAKSWLDYISFGEISTGGWTSSDGIINCVADCYEIESEAFQVSLLKHEAQHAQDLQKYPNMNQQELEYRAKLVELIYTQERDLISEFQLQAGDSTAHARAAKRICTEMNSQYPESSIQEKASYLLKRSNDFLNASKSI